MKSTAIAIITISTTGMMMMMVPRKGGQTRATVVKGEVEGESVVMEHSLQSEAGDGETRKSSENNLVSHCQMKCCQEDED